MRAALAVAGLLLATSCSDRATGTPEAVVGAAVPEPEAGSGRRFVFAEGSSIGFVGSKLTGSHGGGFHGFEGEILLGGGVEQSSVRVTIDTTSLWADNERLAGHLKSADFFEIDSFPQATFRSTEITPGAEGYTVVGNLDLHGVTKSIAFPAKISVEPERITARAEFTIKRFDFGIVYRGRADDLIRDDVVITFDLVALPED